MEYHASKHPAIVYAFEGQVEALEGEIARLRKGIQDYLDGDYEPKVKKIDKCPHGLYGYEACEECISEHFQRLLTPSAPRK